MSLMRMTKAELMERVAELEKETKALRRDAERYHALRRDAYHFSVAIRYMYNSKDEREAKGSWIHCNHVVGTMMDKQIDAWLAHPTYGIPRR